MPPRTPVESSGTAAAEIPRRLRLKRGKVNMNFPFSFVVILKFVVIVKN